MKKWRTLLCLLLAAMLPLGSLGALAEAAKDLSDPLTLEDLEALGATAYTRDGRVTFVDGACTDAPVKSTADAARVVDAMVALTGGDARTRFEPWRDFSDPVGNRYYVFQQMHAGTTVSGGAVKVVTDAEGSMLGLVASVENDLPDVAAAEGITAEAAEALALQKLAEEYPDGAELVEGQTRKVVLPVKLEIDPDDEDDKGEVRFVWAVYTTNPGSAVDKGSDLPYLAHYVTMDGTYLYSLPAVYPGDEASTAGYNAAYVFEFMEPVDYTGTVKLSDGTEKEISVTLMRDTRTGMVYLGNLERRIVVADCYEFLYNKGRVVLEASRDNTGWDDTCLMSLYNYCRAWDYYDAIGWRGGDGLGTPILILKDYCDRHHNPIDNAAYAGHYMGWQLFLSSDANDLAQCLDVLGHEFTHCVTGSVMTYNAYMNDYGAINEAMSDIQGNICEMLYGDTADTTWELGEHSRTPVRNMSTPHTYHQPEFAWDLYYAPNVKVPTDLNDRGGVHTNSSLLNHLAWRLCEKGGMTLEEARVFWFAVDAAMVPGTDYAQLSELLPWVLKNVGMARYMAALEQAIDATRIRTDVMPETFDDDRALLTLTLPDQESFTDGNWSMYILSADVEGFVQRVKDIFAGAPGYEYALRDLAAAMGFDAGEAQETLSLEEATEALITAILEGLTSKNAQEPGDAPAGTEPQEEGGVALDNMYDGAAKWFKDTFGDLFYLGSNGAGQDGRTIRMVCRPGMTLPVLLRLELENEVDIKTFGLAVYTWGRWVDLGAVLESAGDVMSPPENGEMDMAWLDNLLAGLSGEKPSPLEMWVKLFRDPKSILDKVFFEIRPGEIMEIPDTGLDAVRAVDGKLLEALNENGGEGGAATGETPDAATGETPEAAAGETPE
ncbi:MAG: M4 family metallopeptidase, partial [Clostridia bacterium]|nr:M4 family metallopeptidase [Clostridia bacterium]